MRRAGLVTGPACALGVVPTWVEWAEKTLYSGGSASSFSVRSLSKSVGGEAKKTKSLGRRRAGNQPGATGGQVQLR